MHKCVDACRETSSAAKPYAAAIGWKCARDNPEPLVACSLEAVSGALPCISCLFLHEESIWATILWSLWKHTKNTPGSIIYIHDLHSMYLSTLGEKEKATWKQIMIIIAICKYLHLSWGQGFYMFIFIVGKQIPGEPMDNGGGKSKYLEGQWTMEVVNPNT